MLKKWAVVVVFTTLLNTVGLCLPLTNNDRGRNVERYALKIKQSVQKLGTGLNARIKVKLFDGTSVSGFVGAANETDFTVVDIDTNEATKINYSGAKQVRGNNLSSGVKIAIGIGIVVLVLALIARSWD